jgi:hypothetical protein
LGAIVTIWFIIIALMLLAGVVLRFLPRKLAPVQLHKVAPRVAARLVSDFIESSYETDFGYPSGLFNIERATETEVAAKEIVAKGSHFTQVLRGFYSAVLSLGSEFGCLGMVIMLWIAALLTPALLYAALTETLLKYLLRSQIIAALERSGDGTQVTFTLRGPVAMLVGQRLERVFHEPVLPTRIAALAGLAVQQRPTGTGPGAAPEAAAA